jgi:hypothetical protein
MEEHELVAKLLEVSYNKDHVRVRNQWDQGWAVHVVHNVHGTQRPIFQALQSQTLFFQIQPMLDLFV